jgi:hypothetical protein
MDTAVKRRMAERVRRALTKRLRAHGFVRGKTSFWVRSREHVIEFVHLHLFSFAPAFRVHAGIRVLNDDFEAAALNGPDSDGCWLGDRQKNALQFTTSDASIETCAEDIVRFCDEVAEPWFERFSGPRIFLISESPLNDRERSNLESSFKGLAKPETVRFSKELLGVA